MLGGGGSATGRIRPAGGSASINIVPLHIAFFSIKSTNGEFYKEERDVTVVFVDLPPAVPRKPV